MKHKRYPFLAMALVLMTALSSCQHDGAEPDVLPKDAISFGGVADAADNTRATNPTPLADKGVRSFYAVGVKNLAEGGTSGTFDKPSVMMDAYKVNWDATGRQWNYIGQVTDAPGTNNTEPQTVVYWDWSAKAIHFVAWTPYTATDIEHPFIYTPETPTTPGEYTGMELRLPFNGTTATTAENLPYVSLPWLSTNATDGLPYGQTVELHFRKPLCQVRFILTDNAGVPLERSEKTYLLDGIDPDSIYLESPDDALYQKGTLLMKYDFNTGQQTFEPVTEDNNQGTTATGTSTGSDTESSTSSDATPTPEATTDPDEKIALRVPYLEAVSTGGTTNTGTTATGDPWVDQAEPRAIWSRHEAFPTQKWYYLMPYLKDSKLQLRVKLNGHWETVTVPSEYCNWQPGQRYTYSFMVSSTIVFLTSTVDVYDPTLGGTYVVVDNPWNPGTPAGTDPAPNQEGTPTSEATPQSAPDEETPSTDSSAGTATNGTAGDGTTAADNGGTVSDPSATTP